MKTLVNVAMAVVNTREWQVDVGKNNEKCEGGICVNRNLTSHLNKSSTTLLFKFVTRNPHACHIQNDTIQNVFEKIIKMVFWTF